MKSGVPSSSDNSRHRYDFNLNSGFTITELIVVVVIIGLLAIITAVSFSGVINKATAASLITDLDNSSKQLKIFRAVNGGLYPTTIDCAQADSATNKCLKASSGNSYTYQVDNTAIPKTFTLTATKGSVNYRITSHSLPLAVSKICPSGFIVVPGSATYGTSDFCVMKYEANQVGATTTPISQASGIPWAKISQVTASANSPNVVGCTGCHLITEAEWLTIAKNVLSVPSNWSGGSVGNGYIYSGANDGNPNFALVADVNDDNGYIGTGNTSGNQRRTLKLSNGEVIWDFAGNLAEWTAGQTTGGQPGVAGGGAIWREWNAITTHGTISPDPFPSTTGIAGVSSWTSGNGIGKIYSDSDDLVLRALLRSGYWSAGASAGVLSLQLSLVPTYSTNTAIGFRVAK